MGVQRKKLLLLSILTFASACGGGSSSTPPVSNTPPPTANQPPVANAGQDLTANELSVVSLSGSGADSDGSINSYLWQQTSTGTTINLVNANSANASFTAPDLTADEIVTFELTVTDDDNASHKDSVSVTLLNVETTPTPSPTPTDEIPEGGTLIIAENAETIAGFWNGSNAQTPAVGTKSVVNVEHEKFSQALELDITNPSGVSWQGQVSIPVIQNLKVGDKVLLHLYFRTIKSEYETGTGFTRVLLQGPAESDYYKIITRNINSASEWTEYFIAAEVGKEFPANTLDLIFELGAGNKPQKFQLGGIELYNFEQKLALDALPNTQPTYDGRADDAPWRAEALARIEQHRKGDFSIKLQTSTGEAITDTDISVTMVKHAYHFGTAISVPETNADTADGEIYRQKILELFNQAGPENALKWPAWSGEWGSDFSQGNTIKALEWLTEHNLYTRGHVLIWPSKHNMPNAMQQYMPDDPANADQQVLTEVLNHIDDATSKTAHLLSEWDVLNEPFDNHYLMDAFGNELMVDWFARAHTNLPQHKLYINDYSILSAAGLDIAHQNHYKQTIQYLVDQEAKINGIGFQSHFSDVLTGIPKVYQILDEFHQAFPELVIRSTEFDIKTTDETLQADYTRDFMTLFFSHPATVGIQLWGFWAKRHWYPEAAMYREDWSEKPNALVWKDLIFNQWFSQFNGQTDSNGAFSQRGFYGEYEVTFTHQGEVKTLPFSVLKGENNNLTLNLTE